MKIPVKPPQLHPCIHHINQQSPQGQTKENFSSTSSIRPEARCKNNLPIQALRTSSDRLELHFSPVAQAPLLGPVAHQLAVDGAI